MDTAANFLGSASSSLLDYLAAPPGDPARPALDSPALLPVFGAFCRIVPPPSAAGDWLSRFLAGQLS